MFDFFDKIIGFFEMILTFCVNFINGIIALLAIVPAAIGVPLVIGGFMPSIIYTSVMVVLFIAVAKFLIGR